MQNISAVKFLNMDVGQSESVVGLFGCVINCGVELGKPVCSQPNAYLCLPLVVCMLYVHVYQLYCVSIIAR